ncbi:MerR family transcriptional regulator [Sphingobacteriaceae bacterium]|nr:MerR family transcriptional regulator [Sphingobacteriaceae bacterium]
MKNEQLVSLEKLCNHYKIETSFIHSLNEYGLIEITRIDELECVDEEYLSDLESMMNLHYELNVNMEGIDVINHLLKRMKEMQKEVVMLRNRIDHE